MLKRTISFCLVMAMVFSMAISASAESTTLTIEVPEASYTLHVPANQSIDYMASEANIGGVSVSGSSDFSTKELHVTVSYSGQFTTPQHSSVISYALKCKGINSDTRFDLDLNSVIKFTGNEDGTLSTYPQLLDGSPADELIVVIAPESWENLSGGTYSTTITFASSLVDLS